MGEGYMARMIYVEFDELLFQAFWDRIRDAWRRVTVMNDSSMTLVVYKIACRPICIEMSLFNCSVRHTSYSFTVRCS